jgi:predicted DNA-binding transcriptional regulator YafY
VSPFPDRIQEILEASVDRPSRLLALLVALRAVRRTTADDLAEQFGVSRRTILRDVQALVDADVPVVAERGRHGGIGLLYDTQVDVGRLTAAETEVLEVIGVDLERARRLGLEPVARSAAQKLAPRARGHLAHDPDLLPLGDVVAIDDQGWFSPDGPADVSALVTDVRRGRRLRIVYRSSGRREPRVQVVDPHGVFLRGGRWYLIAEAQDGPRMFALVRLSSWTLLDEPRRVDGDRSLREVADALVAGLEQRDDVHVTALLDASVVDMARRILGRRLLSVEPADHPDTVRIMIGYDQLDGVRQLLQFGDHIEVTDPPEARALVAELAGVLAARHTTRSS